MHTAGSSRRHTQSLHLPLAYSREFESCANSLTLTGKKKPVWVFFRELEDKSHMALSVRSTLIDYATTRTVTKPQLSLFGDQLHSEQLQTVQRVASAARLQFGDVLQLQTCTPIGSSTPWTRHGDGAGQAQQAQLQQQQRQLRNTWKETANEWKKNNKYIQNIFASKVNGKADAKKLKETTQHTLYCCLRSVAWVLTVLF